MGFNERPFSVIRTVQNMRLPGELLLAAAVKIAQRSQEETNPRSTGNTLNNG